jgi:Tissue inhibitor of metalloproteinase
MGKRVLTSSAFFALLVLVYGTGSVYACSCMAPKPPCQAVWEADAVFIGTVLSTHDDSKRVIGFDSRLIKFAVEESFRGLASNVVEVFTSQTGAGCGFGFQTGQQYLVYAYKGETGRLSTSICSRTRTITQATEDLSYLRGLLRAPRRSTISGEVQRYKRDSNGNATPSPLPDIRVNVEGATEKSHTFTDEKRNFSITDLASGDYRVSLELPKGLKAGPEEQKVTIAEKGCAFVYFGVESDGLLSGRVLNLSQNPIAAAQFQIITAGREGFRGYWNVTSSNDQGVDEFSKIRPGKYVLLIRFDGTTSQLRPFPRMYYHGVSAQGQATVIEIDEGQRLDATGVKSVIPSHLIPK